MEKRNQKLYVGKEQVRNGEILNKDLISVIVPVYNAQDYLEMCINSIIGQDYINIELILVDDGSTDRSPDICDRFARDNGRIVAIHTNNSGQPHARLTGLRHANGKYIVFVDSDDWIDKEYVSILYKLKEDNHCDCVICSYVAESEREGQKICIPEIQEGLYENSNLKTGFFDNMICIKPFYTFGVAPSVCGGIYDRVRALEIFEKVPEDLSFGEDGTCKYTYLYGCKSIYVSYSPLYHYRQNDGSITKRYNSKQTLQTISLIKYMRDTLDYTKDIRMRWQINNYHLFVLKSNYINVRRKGFSTGFFKRIQEIEKFSRDTGIDSVIRECKVDIKKYASWFDRIILGLIGHKLYFTSILLYCITLLLKG